MIHQKQISQFHMDFSYLFSSKQILISDLPILFQVVKKKVKK